MVIRIAESPADFEKAGQLFLEYAQSLDFDLGFQGFAQEIADLSALYNAKDGGILLLSIDNQTIGCVALKRLNKEIGEIKRMFIQPDWRNKNLANPLLQALITLAKSLNYKALRLDTLDTMQSALRLYKNFGFEEISAYYDTPLKNTVFLELKIAE
jgi:carbonic anhydrase